MEFRYTLIVRGISWSFFSLLMSVEMIHEERQPWLRLDVTTTVVPSSTGISCSGLPTHLGMNIPGCLWAKKCTKIVQVRSKGHIQKSNFSREKLRVNVH